MSDKESIINSYANLFGKSIRKFFHICKYILSREIQETEKNIDQLSILLNDDSNNYLTLSNVFLSSLQPFYELLALNFFPYKSKQFSKVYYHPSYVYPIIQSSILIFTKKLALFYNLVCKSIRENQLKIENFEEKFGLNYISKSVVIIDKNSKINYNDQLKDASFNTPIELIDVYSQYLCENLSNNNYHKGINNLNTIADLLKNSIQEFNDFKVETKELSLKYIPVEIKNHILCEIDHDSVDSSSLSKLFSSFQECNNIQTAKHYDEDEKTKLKNLSVECDKEFREIFKKMLNELEKFNSVKNCNKLDLVDNSVKNINLLMKKYLESLNKITNKLISFISNEDIENEMKFNKILTKMDLDENIYSDEIFVHIDYLPKIMKEIKVLENYIFKLEKKVNKEREIANKYQRLEAIDKSILKYMCETIMRQDIYLHNYLKFNWLNLLFECSLHDVFNQFNINVANKINKNYLLLIGSIYNRLPVSLIYEEESKFFQNKYLLELIKNEYYTSLQTGLGKLLTKIIVEMIEVVKKFDKTQLHTSLDAKPNLNINISKNKLTDDHVPCFCTINYQNTPITLLHNTIDYLITYVCVNNLLSFENNKTLYQLLVNLLMNEPFSNLTEIVYSRWSLWMCIFSGKIESVTWEYNLKLRVTDSNLKEIAFKHLKNHIQDPNTLKFKLVDEKSSYESKINYEKLKEIVQTPTKFPDKNEFLTKIKTNSLKSTHLSMSNSHEQLEEKFILLNKLGKLSCSTLYNYTNYIFIPINVDSKELTINF